MDDDGNGQGGTLSLADYLTANPPTTEDTWTLIYNDIAGGNEQARFVEFNFNTLSEGDSSITVIGTPDVPNVIYGSETGDDLLIGANVDDTILGRGGDDMLIGGEGDDTLAGEGGKDIFEWQAGDEGTDTMPAHDTVTDFTLGVDALSLGDLLGGADVNDLLSNGYISIDHSSEDKTVISIDSSGSGDVVVDQIITLEGVDTTDATLFPSEQAILNNLLDPDTYTG